MKNRIELLARVTLARIFLDALGIRRRVASHKLEDEKAINFKTKSDNKDCNGVIYRDRRPKHQK